MNRKMLHIVSHSHWDREWYMAFQVHRTRLVDLVDSLIDTLDTDPSFCSFHFDGQTIMLDDYLEIQPEKRDHIRRLVQDRRLYVGPWYVLQDEYLTSGESAVRNLLHGLRSARAFGEPTMIGYLPDSFGNISQMPQILRGFGIQSAVFGRGLNRIGTGPSGYHSELTWRSPDGSTVLGIFMANWYNNANEVPGDPTAAKAFLEHARDTAEAAATTVHLLLMNGSDHQPVQRNLGQVIAAVQPSMDDLLVHSNLPEYVTAVCENASDLAIHDGEMDSRYTPGWRTLVNTASARMYLKQMNYTAQRMLEREAEPLATFAWLTGAEYPSALLWHAWKLLLQNHPHDSICGCSVDEVHEEMITRFRGSTQVTKVVTDRAARHLVGRVDAARFGDAATPIVVWNTLGWTRSDMVEMDVDVDKEDTLGPVIIRDAERTTAVLVEDRGIAHTYELPNDTFRVPKDVHRYRVRFPAFDIPGLGYKTFYLVRDSDAVDSPSAPTGSAPAATDVAFDSSTRVLSNVDLEAHILENGSLDLLHKESGRWFRGLLVFEDAGDCGDEYDYRIPVHDVRITTETALPRIERVAAAPGEQAWRIAHTLQLPAFLVREQPTRRSSQQVTCTVDSVIRLRPHGTSLEVRTTVTNTARNHRLRVLFPTSVRADHHVAQGQFDVVERANTPWEGWENPSNCQRQESFVAIEDGQGGMAIANRGLPEYEVVEDGAIALTLLRSVDRMANWQIFSTPGAQCLGTHTFDYAIIPYKGTWLDSGAYQAALSFTVPMPAFQTTVHDGDAADCAAMIGLEAEHLIVSSVKRAEESDSTFILRVYNPSGTGCRLRLRPAFPVSVVHRANLEELLESELAPSTAEDGSKTFDTNVLAKQIATLAITVAPAETA